MIGTDARARRGGGRMACMRLAASLIAALCLTASAPTAADEAVSLEHALVPLAASWIGQSRDAAVAHGVEPIPSGVRRALDGYVPSPVLERVRWCVACGGALSLQATALGSGAAPAITLEDVVVFAAAEHALDPKLWAHELKHVMQYDEWGVEGFAARYLADRGAVEREAWDFRWDFMQRTGRVPKRSALRRAP